MFFLHSALRFCIAAIVIAAVELTITWNAIQGVDSAGSAGQLIPITLGAVSFARVLYIRFKGHKDVTRRQSSRRIHVTSYRAQLETAAPETPPQWSDD